MSSPRTHEPAAPYRGSRFPEGLRSTIYVAGVPSQSYVEYRPGRDVGFGSEGSGLAVAVKIVGEEPQGSIE